MRERNPNKKIPHAFYSGGWWANYYHVYCTMYKYSGEKKKKYNELILLKARRNEKLAPLKGMR